MLASAATGAASVAVPSPPPPFTIELLPLESPDAIGFMYEVWINPTKSAYLYAYILHQVMHDRLVMHGFNPRR